MKKLLSVLIIIFSFSIVSWAQNTGAAYENGLTTTTDDCVEFGANTGNLFPLLDAGFKCGTALVFGSTTQTLGSTAPTSGQYLEWNGTNIVGASVSSTNFEVNGTALSSSSTVNFENSAATDGLTLTFSNPSAGNVQLGFTGTLSNSGLANSSLTFNGVSTALGASGNSNYFTGTPTANDVSYFSSATGGELGDSGTPYTNLVTASSAASAASQFAVSSGANKALTFVSTSPNSTFGQSSATNSSISSTTLISSVPSTPGFYSLKWEISLTTVGVACTGSTTVALNAIWTDPNTSSSTTQTFGTVTIASSGDGTVGFIAEGVDPILAKNATSVSYSTTYTAGSGCTTDPSYQVSYVITQEH